MMKKFILAATSIAYFVSTASIADANSPRVNSVSNLNLLATKASISQSDLKSISDEITRICENMNRAGYAQEKLGSNEHEDTFSAREVKSIKVLSFVRNTSKGTLRNLDIAEIEITLIDRLYFFNGGFYGAVRRGNWALKKQKQIVNKLEFIKQDGKWKAPEQLYYFKS